MLLSFQEHIKNRFPFLQDKKLLVTVSGGVDSVVLAHLLLQSKFTISLAHCNFTLRNSESDKDEEFVKKLGKQWEVPVYTISFQTQKTANKKGISVQMAARELRYQWFNQILKDYQFDYILTAHHNDDALETFLLNTIRGTGLAGLTGIPEINGNIIRPLLIFSRESIEKYAITNHIKWREDKSNTSTKYSRNKIRHQIIPILKEINPNLLTSFNTTLANLKESEYLIKNTITQLQKEIITKKENEIHISISKLQKLNNPKPYLFELLKKYNFAEWNDVTNLLHAQTGKQLFSSTHRLLKNRSTFILTKRTFHQLNKIFYIDKDTTKITEPIPLSFEFNTLVFDGKNKENAFSNWLFSPNSMLFDASKLIFPLTIRKWKEGDYFYPIGLQGKKKISKFFKDEKFSQLQKEQTWLMCSNNEVIWVIGYRMDDRFKVSANTQMIFKVHSLS